MKKSAKWEAVKKLNDALYQAAEKAGMREELAGMQAEVIVSGSGAYLVWEQELSEDESFVFNAKVFARAEKWLAAYVAKKGV